MRPKVRMAALVAAFLLTSCTVGPNYRRPAIDVPSEHRGDPKAAEAATATNTIANLRWWEIFKDPKLTEYIRSAVDGISGKVLTETLRVLERDGVVERYVYAEMPPRVEYELTPLGHTLHEPLRALGTWAERRIEEVLVARDKFDTRHDA